MGDWKLRQSIAAEAARLIVQGKESDYYAARRKAARVHRRQRPTADELPSSSEIQEQVYALAGLFKAERQSSALREMRSAAWELMRLLADFDPRLTGEAITGPILAGAEMRLRLNAAALEQAADVLAAAGVASEFVAVDSHDEASPSRLKLFHRFPCEIAVGEPQGDEWTLPQLEAQLDHQTEHDLLQFDEDEAETDEDGYHPDAIPTMRMLLQALERVKLNPQRHPEGDALYHSLQVYELGLNLHPYDEEFLLACLLHDVGYAIDRRDPLGAARDAIEHLVTPRTWFLIEHRKDAVEYLTTGRIRGSLRKSEHFEDLVSLAQCDQRGRVCGAEVSTVDEALDYITGLGAAWDDA
ncbi:MAG TPA: hypothetical protein VHB77_11250 [Planctomycetaceae bacterium]|nr:hypothetical protein [Planctomycetaceae bacterium]